jgi:hypothetical protein
MNEKKFDLNIKKVLEDWEVYHAVREIIANALDEQVLSQSKDIQIFKDSKGDWHIRDFGRGLRYDHLTQNENEEKLKNPQLIGKFGVGLKDALATFDRREIKVLIKSKFGDITLGKSEKHDFEDIITLHAYLSQPTDRNILGTDFILQGCTISDVEKAKNLFLKFAGESTLEKTPYGEIIQRKSSAARIYLNGIKVAEEENFLFSYNITSLTTAIKKALNRERTNVGRTAYSDRVKSILLACKDKIVAEQLVRDLRQFETGSIHDELKWADVSAHVTKILNSQEKVIFLTPSELTQAPKYVDEAKKAGFEIVTIPDNVKNKISGQVDFSGHPIQDLTEFKDEWNNSFEFKFIDPHRLSISERAIYDTLPKIVELIGGLPANVKQIKISETMRTETYSFVEAAGRWEPSTGSIIIKRSELRNIEEFAGTLLHEIGHARSGAADVSSEFEKSLTELLGKTGSRIGDKKSKPGFLEKIFGC